MKSTTLVTEAAADANAYVPGTTGRFTFPRPKCQQHRWSPVRTRLPQVVPPRRSVRASAPALPPRCYPEWELSRRRYRKINTPRARHHAACEPAPGATNAEARAAAADDAALIDYEGAGQRGSGAAAARPTRLLGKGQFPAFVCGLASAVVVGDCVGGHAFSIWHSIRQTCARVNGCPMHTI